MTWKCNPDGRWAIHLGLYEKAPKPPAPKPATIDLEDYDAVRAILDKMNRVLEHGPRNLAVMDVGYNETAEQLEAAYRWLVTQNTERYFVNEYVVTRAYGGPEEGGWYYDRGEFAECHGDYDTEDEAAAAMGVVQDQFDDLVNEGSLPAGTARPRFLIERRPGENFPQEKPHYE